MNTTPSKMAPVPSEPANPPKPSPTPAAPARGDPSPPPKPERPHRRTGKIARLPKTVRDTINLQLRDGVSYAVIVQNLAAQGHQINDDILCRWHAGGYQDWLDEQACLEEMRLRLDFASELVSQRNFEQLSEASLRIAAVRMYNLLLDFDPADLKDALVASPGLYPRLLNSLYNLTEGALKHQRYRTENAKFHALT